MRGLTDKDQCMSPAGIVKGQNKNERKEGREGGFLAFVLVDIND